ncbi:MAG: choice-of-anchor U domain-containing protein [Pseudomonadota bacterium]
MKKLLLFFLCFNLFSINSANALFQEGFWSNEIAGPDGATIQLGSWGQSLAGTYPNFAGTMVWGESYGDNGIDGLWDNAGEQWAVSGLTRIDSFNNSWTENNGIWTYTTTAFYNSGDLYAPNWTDYQGTIPDVMNGQFTYTISAPLDTNGRFDHVEMIFSDIEFNSQTYHNKDGDDYRIDLYYQFTESPNERKYNIINNEEYIYEMHGDYTFMSIDVYKDNDHDGVKDEIEGESYAGMANVASIKSEEGQEITLASIASKEGETISLENVRNLTENEPSALLASALNEEGFPETTEADFQLGFYDFVVNADSEGKAQVTFTLPEQYAVDTYWKYGPTPDNPDAHWYDFMFDGVTGTGAVLDGNEVTLYFVDGQRGDDDYDLGPNGIIRDLGAPSFSSPTVPVPSAVWLFASGLIGLVGIRRKST